jgi:hypothetical protein
LADDELRHALLTRLPDLQPDVEGELERLLARADSAARRRRTAYVVGLVAAVLVAAGLVVGHDWRTDATRLEPVDHPPVRAQPLAGSRGMYDSPAAIEPGRYRAHLLAPVNRYPELQVELDVPAGWGQDDVYALATGPGEADGTRRIDLYANVPRVIPNACSDDLLRTGSTALDLATTISTTAGRSSSGLTPVTLDGHPGYRLALHEPANGSRSCANMNVWRETPRGSVQAFGLPGWTTLLWVCEVDGVRVVIAARRGPDTTPAQEAELVRMVESASFVAP